MAPKLETNIAFAAYDLLQVVSPGAIAVSYHMLLDAYVRAVSLQL